VERPDDAARRLRSEWESACVESTHAFGCRGARIVVRSRRLLLQLFGSWRARAAPFPHDRRVGAPSTPPRDGRSGRSIDGGQLLTEGACQQLQRYRTAVAGRQHEGMPVFESMRAWQQVGLGAALATLLALAGLIASVLVGGLRRGAFASLLPLRELSPCVTRGVSPSPFGLARARLR
jgi:hypothetical protein